jgi:hypothetical protein
VGYVLAVTFLAAHLAILSIELRTILNAFLARVVLGVVILLLLPRFVVLFVITSALALSGARLALTG